MKNIIAAFMLICLIPSPAQSSDSKTSTQEMALSRLIFESLNGLSAKDRLSQLLAYAAFAGASSETLRKIAGDIENQQQKFQDIRLASNGKIEVGDRPTGLRIVSYAPFNLSLRGRVWYFEKSWNLEENYFALRKFLQPSRTVMNFILPQAFAEDLNSFFDGGASAAYIAALSAINAALPKSGTASPAGSVAWLAALKQASRASEKNARAVVKAILSSDFNLKCDAKTGVTVSSPAVSERAVIRIGAERKGAQVFGWRLSPDRAGVVAFADGKGRELPYVDARAVPAEYQKTLALLCTCKDASQALATKNSIRAAMKSIAAVDSIGISPAPSASTNSNTPLAR